MTNQCRRPPLPFYDSPDGTCRLCGNPVSKPLRNWHPECAKAYSLAVNSGTQRARVWERDKGVCAHCGKATRLWQADHIVPLHSLPQSTLDDFPNCLRFWDIENLQTLCTSPCHQAKSAKEATNRAKVKRIRNKHLGIKRKTKKIQSRPFPKSQKLLTRTLKTAPRIDFEPTELPLPH